jgi:beta-lactamase superfamily II metal-dependent hydrolase
MIIKFLQANNGDAIHISFNNKNILIDTGIGATFHSKPNGRPKDGELKKLINDLQNKNEKIDLLIITHWDDDHIGGVLKLFTEDLESAKFMIKHIWFNSGLLINKYFQSNKASGDNTVINSEYTPHTSVRQGIKFEKYLLDKDISYSLIKTNTTDIDNIIDGVIFTILSPTDKELEKLLVKWEHEYNPNTSASNKDYDKSFEELLLNEFQEDNAIHNGSSIAFILEIENKKMLFLGDAHPSIVVDRLKDLSYSKINKLKIDFMKVSHHGSKANTSSELLDIIDCENFVISTDGSKHGLPNKETIARIISKHENCKIYFNYPHLINQIFTDEELKSEKFEALDTSGFDI